jgi:endonuclease/exonuclease/phosphatase (EEP) superfamily protein YafD
MVEEESRIGDDGPIDRARAPTARRTTRRPLKWASVVLLAGLALPALARLTGWEPGPVVWLVALMPWFTFACLLPFALALLGRSWPLAAASGALATLGIAWLAPLYVAEGAPGEGDAVLRIASANLLLGQADADAVVTMVREREIHVLAVQELTPDAADRLREAGLDVLMPYSALEDELGAGGSGLWSRLPLSEPTTVEGLSFNAVRADIEVEGRAVAVFSVHPFPPGPRDHERWSADLAQLAVVLEAETGPAVVAGDFNATRDHRAFRQLEALGYVDAADQAGAGFVPTFPEGLLPTPVVAIDHVIARDVPWAATEVVSVALTDTDHRALVVTYSGT